MRVLTHFALHPLSGQPHAPPLPSLALIVRPLELPALRNAPSTPLLPIIKVTAAPPAVLTPRLINLELCP